MMANQDLPGIPDKLYFTIGEVARLCQLQPHVLRYWEQEFSQLTPLKRRGNRRYYQNKDILLVRQIRSLLYEQGYTINGAKKALSESQLEVSKSKGNNQQLLHTTLEQLEKLLDDLQTDDSSH